MHMNGQLFFMSKQKLEIKSFEKCNGAMFPLGILFSKQKLNGFANKRDSSTTCDHLLDL